MERQWLPSQGVLTGDLYLDSESSIAPTLTTYRLQYVDYQIEASIRQSEPLLLL